MKIIPTRQFKADTDFYIRKKKYLKILDDIKTVTDELSKGNLIGDKLEGLRLQENTAAYKVRVANTSTKSGKSNGFRIIYYVIFEEKIYLLTIYSKKDSNNIPNDSQIEMLIKNVIEEKNDSQRNF